MAVTTTIVFEDHRMVITMPDKVIVLRPLDIRQATVVNNSNRPDRGSLQFASPPQVPYPSLTLKLLTEWGDEVDINLSEVSEPASWNNGESGAKDALIDLTPYIRKDPPVSSGGGGGGDVTIVTTDNLTTVDANEPGPTYSLRQTTISYEDASGATVFLTPVNTGYDGSAYLVPDGVLSRFSLFTTDGLTPILRGDIANPNQNAPQIRIPYRDSANASQVTGAYDTDFASGTMRPNTEVPRREIPVNGSGSGQYVTLADLLANTVPNVVSNALNSYFHFAANHDTTLVHTVQSGGPLVGLYTSITDSGGNGTITVSINGGAFVSFASINPLNLVATNTIQFKRTTYSSAGWALITGTF